MIELRDKSSGQEVGTISETQFRYLTALLEEESLEDQDYYINQATLDLLRQSGADAALVTLLERALAGRDDMDIEWSRR